MFGSSSYTGKDIVAIRNEILDYVKDNNPDWADFNESSIQMQYTEMLAGVADMLCYYLDSQALETYLTTARQKKNINAILKTINYEVETVGPSQGSVTFERSPHEQDEDGNPVYLTDRYFIPKYLPLWTDDKIYYLTAEAMTMDADKRELTVPIIQGTLINRAFPIDVVKESFRLQVVSKPAPLEYVYIRNEGFTRVDDAFTVTTGGPYYSVHSDSYDNVYILFTYDWKKYLPESGDLIVSYVDTIGLAGNIGSGKINNYGDGIRVIDQSATSDLIELTVTNKTSTFGGFSDIDMRKHQANAKNWLLSHDTIVLLKDFETHVRKESWVLDCVCFDWRKDDTIVQYPYQLKAWVVSLEGPQLADDEIRLLTYRLQEKTVIMNRVEIKNANFVDFELRVYLTVTGNNYTLKESVRQKVENTLKSWYLWGNYIQGDPESRLVFGLSIIKTKLTYDIAGLASSITNVELSMEEDINLGKTEFLFCKGILVELVS